jgi:flagellar basal body-associated protein FliL
MENKMDSESKKKSGSLWKYIGYAVLILIIHQLIYIMYMTREVSQIRQLCMDITLGITVDEMLNKISIYGGNRHQGRSSKIADNEEVWVALVCAASTMCETRCSIYHNETNVIEAKL